MGNYQIDGPVLWKTKNTGPATWQTRRIYVHDGVVSTRPKDGTVYEKLTGYTIPGLVDVHAHVGLDVQGATDLETAREQALADLRAGTLLIRDAGSPLDTSQLAADPSLPRLLRAGRHLARPKRYLRYYGRELTDPTQLPTAVAAEARRGNGWVKIVGDWIDRTGGAESDLEPLWETAVLRDAVAAAHENGARVTVHSFAHATIDQLLEAGVDCIEHATGADSDQLKELAARGIPVTPTVLQVDRFADFSQAAGDKYPMYGRTMLDMYDQRLEHMQLMVDLGVHLLPGTDAGGYQKHGSLPQELARWPQLGLHPQQVLDLATWQARDYLGQDSLGEGASADLVVYASDPRADLAALCGARQVISRGQLVHRVDQCAHMDAHGLGEPERGPGSAPGGGGGCGA